MKFRLRCQVILKEAQFHNRSISPSTARPLVFSFNEPAGWSRSNLQWETKTLSFTATSTTTSLEFQATSGFLRGAIISDVSIAAANSPNVSGNQFSLLDDANGRFAIDNDTGEIRVANSSDLDFESDASHTVEVQVEDADGAKYSEFVKIVVNDVNEAPIVNVASVPVAEGATNFVISNSFLNAVDVDTLSQNITYTVVDDPLAGFLTLSGIQLSDGDTFTQKNVDDGLVAYTHLGAELGSDSVELSVVDDEMDRPAQDVNLAFNVSQVNDSPVVNSGGFVLRDVLENSTNPSGETVAVILGSGGVGAVTDADPGAVMGLAVVAVDDSNGEWQFSTNSGVNWSSFCQPRRLAGSC